MLYYKWLIFVKVILKEKLKAIICFQERKPRDEKNRICSKRTGQKSARKSRKFATANNRAQSETK